MNIEGTYTLQASPEHVWQALMDQEVLLRTIPGIEQLEQVGEDTYEVVMQIQHSPLRGAYRGQITLSEQQYPYHYRISVQGEGRQITMNGSGSIHLNGHNQTTVIAYKGTLTSGLPVMAVKGAAKLLIQQFFTTLASQLRSQRDGQIVDSEEDTEKVMVVRRPTGNIVILPPVSATEVAEKTTVMRFIVRLLGLGAGDPVQEGEWETRIRRTGMIAALLVLIWIGMRLPRRM